VNNTPFDPDPWGVGMLGEYIGAIYTQVEHHPLAIEKEQ